MPRINRTQLPLFDGATATGVSGAVDVASFRHIVVAVTATANATLTFKFQGSIMNTAPTFSSAQAVDNIWDYLECYDLQDRTSAITGDTGVTLNNDTVANNTRQYMINTDHMKWFSMQVSAYTDGTFTAYLIAAND